MSATKHLPIRIAQHDLDRIDELAARHHMNRSQYIRAVATGQLPAQRSEAMERIHSLEEQVNRLNEAVFAGNGW